MKTNTVRPKGSALITVILLCGFMAILAASMLRYSASERRGNERNRLILRAKNQAENLTIYAAEQLTTKLYRLGSAQRMAFDWTGHGRNRVYPPPDAVLNSAYSSAANAEVRAGIDTTSPLTLVEDTTDPNFGLQVAKARVPIVAKAVVNHPALGSYTSYAEQDMEIALTPLFQFGMFYNMDLELYPSQAFTVAGPVHSNKRILAKPDGNANVSITFLKRVTCAEGFFADAAVKSPTRGNGGGQTTQDPTTGQVVLSHTNGTLPSPGMKNASNGWRDHKYMTSSETTTTISQFKTWATNTYNGNLRTSAHGVTPLELPGVGSYKETNDPSTPEDDRNNGRQIIEPPNPHKYDGSSWVATTDDADTKESKISYKAGLFIMVNPDYHVTPRSGILPTGATAWVLPGTYRAWLNYLDGSGTRVCTEVVLPGQPSYGYSAGPDTTLGTADDVMYRNYFPNRYTEQSVTGGGTGNQVLRIPQSGYNLASGYRANGTAAIGATTLNIDTGTGQILAGEVVTIGSHSYVVASHFSGGSGTLTLVSGLRAAVADNDAVTLVPYGTISVPTSAYTVYTAHAAGVTAINLRTANAGGSGAITPGSTITIGSHKYLVTAAPTSGAPNNSTTYTINIAAPGLRGGSVASGTAVTIDTTSYDVGTGQGYRLSGAHTAGATSLTVGTGSGTILPGNVLFIGGVRYLVTSALNGSTVTVYPGLASTSIADGTMVIVDPFSESGYSRSTVYPVANTGIAFPTDSTPPYVPADAYFFDMRRANSNRGVVAYSGTTALYNRNGVPYRPRAIAKIDFDMTRFKMMVNRVLGTAAVGASGTTTATVYDVRAPNAAGVAWANSIFNTAATAASLGLGTGASFNTFPTDSDANTRVRLDPYNIYLAPADPEGADLAAVVDDPLSRLVAPGLLYDNSTPDAWYDGIAVYLHSVHAERRAQTSGVPDRVDSGVRLWNGRGLVASLSATNKTGFTFVTNDAVYTVGHFNADGIVNSNQNSVTNPGGYSAIYPDVANEKLCAVMGDAFTALPQPTWSSNSSGQANGWNDALSAFPVAANNADWETGSSSTSGLNGNDDGVYVATAAAGVRPGLLPNNSYPGALGDAKNIKLVAIDTEISTALLMGIVPSNHNPTGLTDGYVPGSFLSSGTPAKVGNGVNSGGANNFPRLLDNWSGEGLYIRGSIVALFESRVAMEPFTNSRCYRAPGRYWGLHYNFSQASHDVPLEPIVIGSSRVGFRELSPTEYASKKSAIESWPH